MSAIPRADRRGVQSEATRNIDPPRRILVLLVAGIGDLVLATPALRALRETFPSAEITLLTSRKAALLATTLPIVDQVQTFETPKSLLKSRNFLAASNQLGALRRRSFDVLVNLYPVLSLRGSWTMRLFNRAVAARQTVGRNTDGRGTFYDRRLAETLSGNTLHEADRMLEVVRLIGATTQQLRPQVWIPPRYARRASRWLSSGRPRVVIQAGSQSYKRWPPERYRRLAEEIHRKWNAEILWNGSPDERNWITSICSPLEFETGNLAGECDVLELSALLQRCDLLVSNDSGPMHIAAALGVPLVALFGGSNLERFDPRRTEPRSRVVAAESSNEVSLDAVIQAADELLTSGN
ncbi:MAG: glycosyltransferase family 9 protein [Acidobacteriota bacterium]